ncbi:restriction endonuclease [Nonlabens sp. Ci31]|jgi:5-methylcytosine-specific restriction enzyme subunit McrC|uniref:McrC family protein n=1 Tax=Nonlabens sp. Ci31 TaxID=2608253 RepID=UPI001463DE6D|nr:restriction endonuclease [Nonlabens sp. Ci31]QJP34338.1 restriction endonuclease [Nonlabens sp. Ci31]
MSKKPNSISVFEYESITHVKGKRFYNAKFSKVIYESFLSFHEREPNTPFFDLIHNGVRFKNYVGAIQIGKTTIEVLPKAGKNENRQEWQHVLLTMLKTCHLLTAKESGSASLKLRANSVLELYFELFLNEVEALIRRGLIKKYSKQQGQQRALKGALVFSQQLSKNLVHKERFFTLHTIYSKDHLIHQILNEALFVISIISTDSNLADKMGRVRSLFPEVSRVKVNATLFERIVLSRKHKPYQKVLSIAKLILLNYRPDIKAGRKDLLAIMFDMNRLWEEYVLQILRKGNDGSWQIKGQESQLFWRRKTIRPDIVLEKEGVKYVIDTKWKVIDSNRPSDADLKQMYVYNHHWNAQQSMLLYPNDGFQTYNSGKFELPYLDKGHHSCKLGFVHVIKESSLNLQMATDIFGLLDHENHRNTLLTQ